MPALRTTTAIALATMAVATAASPTTASASPAHTSVVGGRAASIAEFPSLAYVVGGGGAGSFSCTGSVIAPRVVLTAGHCVDNVGSLTKWRASDFAVATGIADISDPPRSSISSVSRIVTYPGYNPSKVQGDAGLIILSEPVSAPAIPLVSPATSSLLAAGTPASVAGWGIDRVEPLHVPAVLQTGDLTVDSAEACKLKLKRVYPIFSPTLQLCAVDLPDLTTTICNGDSGGPLIARAADGAQVQIGIISAGEAFCDTKVPGIFTRTDLISSWAEGWIAAVEAGAPEPTLPRARLPRLGRFEAADLAASTLHEAFPEAKAVFAGCPTRLSQTKLRCEADSRSRKSTFFGTATVAYAIRDNSVVFTGHYAFHRVSTRCLSQARNSRSCPVQTRRG